MFSGFPPFGAAVLFFGGGEMRQGPSVQGLPDGKYFSGRHDDRHPVGPFLLVPDVGAQADCAQALVKLARVFPIGPLDQELPWSDVGQLVPSAAAGRPASGTRIS